MICMLIPVIGRIGENTNMVYSPMVVISRSRAELLEVWLALTID